MQKGTTGKERDGGLDKQNVSRMNDALAIGGVSLKVSHPSHSLNKYIAN